MGLFSKLDGSLTQIDVFQGVKVLQTLNFGDIVLIQLYGLDFLQFG